MASIIPLTAQAASYDAATHQAVVDFNDLRGVADATAKTVSIALTANTATDQASIEFLGATITPFTGASFTTGTVTIGDAGLATRFASAKQINAGNANPVKRLTENGGKQDMTTELKFVFAAPASGKNLDEYKGGKIVARFRINNGY